MIFLDIFLFCIDILRVFKIVSNHDRNREINWSFYELVSLIIRTWRGRDQEEEEEYLGLFQL